MSNAEKILHDGWELHVALRCCQSVQGSANPVVSEDFCYNMIMKMRKSRFFRWRFLRKSRSIWSFRPYCMMYGRGSKEMFIGERP